MPWDEEKTNNYLSYYYSTKSSLTNYYRSIFNDLISDNELLFYLSVTGWLDSGGPHVNTYKNYIFLNKKEFIYF